ncbi:hypothetical protein HII31_09042 [Pseudocercospora fuligena]|uniref:Myb-like domain-containing protein n=1 Tax=Pseudocercospora fuligena TaxID=685502 RepID=A0A8H6VEP1_9PEZI|nr:hypothetical protein HII31_09042 [Pseudocercospora fuligena]
MSIIPCEGQKYASGIAQSASKNTKPRWSAADVDQLRQLSAEGKSVKEIALSLGRSYNSVMTKRRLNKSDMDKILAGSLVRRSFWSESEVSKLVEARKQGVSIKQISEMLGKTCRSIERKLHHMGLRRAGHPKVPPVTKPRAWTLEEVQHLDKLVRQGASSPEIATVMHRSLSSVRSRIHRGGSIVNLFTEEEDAKLTSLLEDGVKWDAVQAAFASRSLPSLRRRAYVLGLSNYGRKRVFWSEKELATLTQLHAEGRSFREISEHLPGRTVAACMTKLCYFQNADAAADAT